MILKDITNKKIVVPSIVLPPYQIVTMLQEILLDIYIIDALPCDGYGHTLIRMHKVANYKSNN
jgi:hypothetical protein